MVTVSPVRLPQARPHPEAGTVTWKTPVCTPLPQVTEQLPYVKFPSQFTTGTTNEGKVEGRKPRKKAKIKKTSRRGQKRVRKRDA